MPMMTLAVLVAALAWTSPALAQVRPPVFTDPARAQKLAAAFPAIEKAFLAWAERVHAPGAVMGIVIDGKLAWVKSTGVADTATKAPVTPATVFRIASMTKSFTALAIMQLRDAGKLGLDDEVARYVPELAELRYPSTDAPKLTIRHLLTHSEGFPEDNPWGDQQLAQPQETMSRWMRAGIPFSTVPGTAYEYSNYGFAILGQIVERVAKEPYDTYVTEKILRPLGMAGSTFHADRVPADRIGRGYRWEDDRWKPEIPLDHGTFGAMGGLWTNTDDLVKYVAFHLAAWPPRDDADPGPAKRASVREMHQPWRLQPARIVKGAAGSDLRVTSYGYGLGVAQDCRIDHHVSHGGGLPGYGSLMHWMPDYGIGIIGMANVTYAGWRPVFAQAIDAMAATGALQPRAVQPSHDLLRLKGEVSRLVTEWDAALANRIAADNLFKDLSADRRASRVRELTAIHGACRDGEIAAENALRGTWRMTCERGALDVTITLAPTMPPTVQYLDVVSIPAGDARLNARRDASRCDP